MQDVLPLTRVYADPSVDPIRVLKNIRENASFAAAAIDGSLVGCTAPKADDVVCTIRWGGCLVMDEPFYFRVRPRSRGGTYVVVELGDFQQDGTDWWQADIVGDGRRPTRALQRPTTLPRFARAAFAAECQVVGQTVMSSCTVAALVPKRASRCWDWRPLRTSRPTDSIAWSTNWSRLAWRKTGEYDGFDAWIGHRQPRNSSWAVVIVLDADPSVGARCAAGWRLSGSCTQCARG